MDENCSIKKPVTDLTKAHLRLVRRKVVEDGLVSGMNDTKWNELFREIQENWVGWCYRQKSIFEEDFAILSAPPEGWEGDWWYGFWNVEIEIMDIHPFTYELSGKSLNQGGDFESLLRKVGIPFESHADYFRIRGYTRPTKINRSEGGGGISGALRASP